MEKAEKMEDTEATKGMAAEATRGMPVEATKGMMAPEATKVMMSPETIKGVMVVGEDAKTSSPGGDEMTFIVPGPSVTTTTVPHKQREPSELYRAEQPFHTVFRAAAPCVRIKIEKNTDAANLPSDGQPHFIYRTPSGTVKTETRVPPVQIMMG